MRIHSAKLLLAKRKMETLVDHLKRVKFQLEAEELLVWFILQADGVTVEVRVNEGLVGWSMK